MRKCCCGREPRNAHTTTMGLQTLGRAAPCMLPAERGCRPIFQDPLRTSRFPFSHCALCSSPLSPSVEVRTQGGAGQGLGEEVGKENFPSGLSLSFSFLLSRVTFDAPRFPTSHSKHFLPGPLSCSGYRTQSEFLQPDGDFVERMPGPPDLSPCPAVAGVRPPSETLQFPPRLRYQPQVP